MSGQEHPTSRLPKYRRPNDTHIYPRNFIVSLIFEKRLFWLFLLLQDQLGILEQFIS